MKLTINIFLMLILSTIVVKAESYIVKFKEKPKSTIMLQNTFDRFEPALRYNLQNNIKSIGLLSVKQNHLLDELYKYYIVEADDIETLRILENVESITPNYIYRVNKIYEKPNDKLYDKQWSLKQVNAERAWMTATGKGVIIGLIDTGIDFEHEDLIDKLWINNPEDINRNGRFDPWSSDSVINNVSGDFNGIDEDNNGFADDVIGYDFVDQAYANYGDYTNPDPIPEDEGRHGTSVAGIMLASTNNESGIAGVAPDAMVLTAKAFDATGNAEADDIANAIVYAVINGAKVLNFSFGERYNSPLMHDAVKFAYASDVTMVASSGNNNFYGEHYPSDYREVISVGGSDEYGNKFGLSNYGSYLDLIAPGMNVWTLNYGNEYRQESGTSLSAPFVSGAAALLLEIDPELKPEEIRGILQASARDVGEPGWDIKHGSGILDIAKAVSYTGKTNISVDSPVDKNIINTTGMDNLTITGNILTPQFDKYEIFIGKGILPDKWNKADFDKYHQVKDSVIGVIDKIFLMDTVASNQFKFTDTIFTIAIKVHLKNTNTIERRFQIQTLSDPENFQLVNFNHRDAIDKNEAIYFVYGQTTQKALFSLKYRIKGEQDYITMNDDITKDYFHLIKIRNLEYGAEYEGIAEFRINDDIRINEEFEFSVEERNFREDGFVRKFNSIKRSYLWNQTADIYSNGHQFFAINDLSSLDIENSEIYYYEDEEFYLAERSKEKWICKGLGDTDGDGNTEFLGTGLFRTVLYEFNRNSGKLFDNIIFESKLGETFWSEHLFDIDGDGKDEIIAYNDTSYFAVKYIDNEYKTVAYAPMKESLKRLGVNKGSTLGDFDGDGNIELAHSNDYGFLYIYKYNNENFEPVFIDSTNISFSNQYMTSGDITGNGRQEIIHLSSGSRYLYGRDAAVKNVWYLRIFTFKNNTYELLADEIIFGVRAGYISRLGISYRNGISSGDVDGKPGDEILVSAFPNLYVFKYEDERLTPLWYNPNTLSNDVIINDFDGNGINEIGFSGFGNTMFYEYQPDNDAPKTPVNVNGWALNDTTAYLEWTGSADAELYQIYEIIFHGNSADAELRGLSNNSKVILDSLIPEKTYYFSVVAYNSNRNNQFSNFSELVEVYTHNLYSPIEIEILSDNQLMILFDGSLKNGSHKTGEFTIRDSVHITPQTAVRTEKDKILVTYSNSLPEGEYILDIGELTDIYNSPTLSASLNFEILKSDAEGELYLTRLQLLSKSLIKLEFSEKVVPEEAINPDNYIIKPFGKVEYINTGKIDSTFIMMNISSVFRSDAARGFDYTLTAKNIRSLTGKPMTEGPGNTLGFVVASQTLDEAYVYPNPIKLSETTPIFFANLTKYATVTILTLEGNTLRTLIEDDGNGGVEWDGKDSNGKQLPSGIYLFKVEGINEAEIQSGPVYKKFMILD